MFSNIKKKKKILSEKTAKSRKIHNVHKKLKNNHNILRILNFLANKLSNYHCRLIKHEKYVNNISKYSTKTCTINIRYLRQFLIEFTFIFSSTKYIKNKHSITFYSQD